LCAQRVVAAGQTWPSDMLLRFEHNTLCPTSAERLGLRGCRVGLVDYSMRCCGCRVNSSPRRLLKMRKVIAEDSANTLVCYIRLALLILHNVSRLRQHHSNRTGVSSRHSTANARTPAKYGVQRELSMRMQGHLIDVHAGGSPRAHACLAVMQAQPFHVPAFMTLPVLAFYPTSTRRSSIV